jgi:hypothetical protein
MNKMRIIFICLFIGIFVLIVYPFLKVKNKEVYRQKIVLAQEIRKSLDHLMPDLYTVSADAIKDVPADGQWYDQITFEDARQGVVVYKLRAGHLWRLIQGHDLLIARDIGALRVRRQKETPDILEVQIEAKNNVTLVSNVRIRIRH